MERIEHRSSKGVKLMVPLPLNNVCKKRTLLSLRYGLGWHGHGWTTNNPFVSEGGIVRRMDLPLFPIRDKLFGKRVGNGLVKRRYRQYFADFEFKTLSSLQEPRS